jgi:hypothetical protein
MEFSFSVIYIYIHALNFSVNLPTRKCYTNIIMASEVLPGSDCYQDGSLENS